MLAELARRAPGVDISVRQLLPPGGSRQSAARGRRSLPRSKRATSMSRSRRSTKCRSRFAAQVLYQEDFVIAMRGKHPFAADPSLKRFCAMRHVVVSLGRRCVRVRRQCARREGTVAPGRADRPELHDGTRDNRRDGPDRRAAAAIRGGAGRALRRRQRGGAAAVAALSTFAPWSPRSRWRMRGSPGCSRQCVRRQRTAARRRHGGARGVDVGRNHQAQKRHIEITIGASFRPTFPPQSAAFNQLRRVR